MQKITISPKNTNWTRQCNPYIVGGGAAVAAPKAERKAIKPAVKIEKPKTVTASAGTSVKSPLPGTITSVEVKVGDMVKAGDTVVVLEAMKMQNNIETETAGKVVEIKVAKGDSVMENSVLVVIE